MNSFYITGLSHKPPQIQSQSLEKDSNTMQDLYLRYLIDQETKFANIEKIDTYYQSNAIKKYNQFNHNMYQIHLKKIEYNQLLLEVTENVFQNYIFRKTVITDAYDREIFDLTQQIKEQEHNEEIYSHMHNRLYHDNYMMKKRIEMEQKYSSVYSQQHQKYNLLNQNSKMIMQKQQRTLSETSQYYRKSSDQKQKEFIKKGKNLDQLEYDADFYQVNVAKYKQTMKIIHDTQITKLKEKNKRKISNAFELRNYQNRKKEYHKMHTHILSIFKELQVKDLDELIAKFITIKVEIRNIHSAFSFQNEIIQYLNNTNTEHEELLSFYRKQINSKCKNSETEINSNYLTLSLQSKLDKKRYTSGELNTMCTQKLFFFQKIVTFLINSNKKLNKEMHIKSFTRKRSSLSCLINDKEMKVSETDIDVIFVKTVFDLFVLFSNSFFFLLFRCFNCVVSEKLSSTSIDDNAKSTRVSYLFSKDNLDLYYNFSDNAVSNNETKLKYKKKNVENLYVNMNLQKTKKEKVIRTERKGITQRELLNSFIDHLEKKKKGNIKALNETASSFNGRFFIEKHPKKIISILGKYQNELVSNKMPLIKSPSIDNRPNRTSAVSINTQWKNISLEHTQSTIDWENSYEKSRRESKKSREIKPTQLVYSFYKGNDQMSRIYNRLNDLRSLELKYKENTDINHEELTEVYNSFKSKLFKKDKRKRLLSQSILYLKTNRMVKSEELRSFCTNK